MKSLILTILIVLAETFVSVGSAIPVLNIPVSESVQLQDKEISVGVGLFTDSISNLSTQIFIYSMLKKIQSVFRKIELKPF
jgi:hypothetical protein